MMVPQTLPDSRATVEKSAVAKASIRPTRASRNRTQTCASRSRGKRDGDDGCGMFCALADIALLIRLLSVATFLVPAYDGEWASGSDGRYFDRRSDHRPDQISEAYFNSNESRNGWMPERSLP